MHVNPLICWQSVISSCVEKEMMEGFSPCQIPMNSIFWKLYLHLMSQKALLLKSQLEVRGEMERAEFHLYPLAQCSLEPFFVVWLTAL